ncbi:DUF418 domain-containing protein, partial [Nanoarchaeota archaeon]
MGVSLVLSAKRGYDLKAVVRKGLIFIVFGLVFVNFWPGDILHYLGLYMIIGFVLLRFGRWVRTGIAAGFIFLAPVVLKFIDFRSGWEVFALTFSNFWSVQGFFSNLIVNGFFPMFPWLGYTIAGTVIADWMLDTKGEDFGMFGTFIGLSMAAVGFFVNYTTEYQLTAFPANIVYVIYTLGLFLMIFSVMYLLLDVHKVGNKAFSPIVMWGSSSLSAYLIHIGLGISIFSLTGMLHSFSIMQVVGLSLIMLFVLWVLAFVSFKKWKYGPVEHLLRKVLKSFSVSSEHKS